MIWLWVQGVARALPPKSWGIIAGALAVLAVGLVIYFAGRGDEKADNDTRVAKREIAAGADREIAATERATETENITARQKENDDAARDLPDSLPDDREFRRRCRQLRDAGRDLPQCRGLAG